MDQRAAFGATVELARKHGMDLVVTADDSLSAHHLLEMQKRIHSGYFSPSRLGRWLGWAQAALVAANVGVSLEDVKQLNLSHAGGDTPVVVCLCGSTRFYDEFQKANYDLTMKGEIVLSVGFYPHAAAEHGHGEGVGHDSVEKVALDELHKRKIDLADYVYVLNVGGYIGESTHSEIDYAIAHGKQVRYLEPVWGG